MAAIDKDRPVIVTFCYSPSARQGLAAARRRMKDCFSAVGVGYMNYGNQKLLICRDGIRSTQTYPALFDKVSETDLGINTRDRPWGQPGISLYRWKGDYQNLVMLFVSNPDK